jgi:hypothetical protein
VAFLFLDADLLYIAGFDHDVIPRPLFSASPEERLLLWEDYWAKGGFRILVANFNDMTVNEDAN